MRFSLPHCKARLFVQTPDINQWLGPNNITVDWIGGDIIEELPNNSTDLIGQASQFVRNCDVMVVSVSDGDQPLAATVIYVTLDGTHLYFKSRLESQHSRVLSENPLLAAVAIY